MSLFSLVSLLSLVLHTSLGYTLLREEGAGARNSGVVSQNVLPAIEEEHAAKVVSGETSSYFHRLPPSPGGEASESALRPEPMWKVPVAFTPLIGREQEVASVCVLLKRPAVRLLTLVGAGGIGKTRLSWQVATEIREYFADGVCFVHLAAVSDPQLVVPTIAQELGIQQIGAQPIFEQLKVALRDKHFLLLLDNFEQIVTAAPFIEELLVACPGLKIVVTSREVLHVRGEQEFPVSPLSLPDLTQVPAVDSSAQSAAVALFVQRAQSILPTCDCRDLCAPGWLTARYRTGCGPCQTVTAAGLTLPPLKTTASACRGTTDIS